MELFDAAQSAQRDRMVDGMLANLDQQEKHFSPLLGQKLW